MDYRTPNPKTANELRRLDEGRLTFPPPSKERMRIREQVCAGD